MKSCDERWAVACLPSSWSKSSQVWILDCITFKLYPVLDSIKGIGEYDGTSGLLFPEKFEMKAESSSLYHVPCIIKCI